MYDKDRWSQEIIPFLDHYMAAMHKDERSELETKCTLASRWRPQNPAI